jgi:UDP-N-acetylmuramate-alanine ligase
MEVELIADKKQIVEQVRKKLNPGDVVLTLGAGDIDKVAEALVEALK